MREFKDMKFEEDFVRILFANLTLTNFSPARCQSRSNRK